MNKRILTIVAVFVVGFGLGYALTWILVDGPPSGTAPSAGSEITVSEGGASQGESRDVAEPRSNNDVSGAGTGVVAGEPSKAVLIADTVSGAPDTGGDVAVSAQPKAPNSGEPAVLAKSDTAEEKDWWDACKARRCQMNWGRVTGGISIRRGKLEHGQPVDWAKDFAKAERLGVLPGEDRVGVDVHAIGMTHGIPSAAWITYTEGKQKRSGVIALLIGEKLITMHPPTE